MIIIKTPQPDTEERLVLVPALHALCPSARDATPADMARGGWVTGEMLAEQVRIVWAAGQTAIAVAEQTNPVAVAMLRKLKARAEKAERELEDAESRAAHMLEVIRERDTLRAELARLTAPGEGSEGEPTYEALGEHYRNAWDASKAMLEMGRRHDAYAALYRLGVAHERARSVTPVSSTPVSSGRATDEELVTIARAAYEAPYSEVPWLLRMSRAVAARVRQERCLVAQAVAAKVNVAVWYCDAGWAVSAQGRCVSRLKDADVPATLARLLGEVSR